MILETFPGNGHLMLAAHGAVSKAIKTGELVRPDCCSRCGESPVGRHGQSLIHAHHDDYSRPLDVMWLCTRCHRERHRELGWGFDSGSPDAYKTKRHKLYIDSALMGAFDAACRLVGKSRSEVLVRLCKVPLRKNAAKLRAAGHELSPELFKK